MSKSARKALFWYFGTIIGSIVIAALLMSNSSAGNAMIGAGIFYVLIVFGGPVLIGLGFVIALLWFWGAFGND